MQIDKLFFLLPFIFFCTSCISQSYEVQSVCEVTDLYNYIVKWEVAPKIDGEVSIYASTDPERFDLKRPIARERISKGRADIVVNGSLNRRYFLLKFEDETTSVVGVRFQRLENVENFRDMGGYENLDGHSLKWGKIYRSGNLDSIQGLSAKRVSKMNVATLIDLRMGASSPSALADMGISQYINLPISTTMPNALPLILQQRFKRGDAVIYMQDVMCDMILSSKASLQEMFHLLAEEKNYPLAFCCRYGNLQASIAGALILYALDMPDQVVMEDYLLSNRYFNMRKFAAMAYDLPLESQDAITSMMISDERYLLSAIETVRRKYGSVNAFLRDELGVNDDMKKKLKAILLE